MNRRDQIEKAAKEDAEQTFKYPDHEPNWQQFIKGAQWADANPLPTTLVVLNAVEQIALLEQKLAIAWNALQEVKENGIVDCPECQGHERIADTALSEIEKVGKQNG